MTLTTRANGQEQAWDRRSRPGGELGPEVSDTRATRERWARCASGIRLWTIGFVLVLVSFVGAVAFYVWDRRRSD